MARKRTKIGKGRARQLMTGNRGRPLAGDIVQGTISDYNPTMQTYTVVVEGQPCPGAVLVTGLTSALIGFKMTSILAHGTQVAVLFGSPCWIIGTATNDAPDPDSFMSRFMTGTAVPGSPERPADNTEVPKQSMSGELYQGEFEISNLMGTFIRFLTFMSSMGAGERAKVECHLLRDLVRIVSRNFELFSAAGDLKIFDDGRMTAELNGTTYDHERWGVMTPNSAKFEPKGPGGTDMPDLDPKETGRWRYTMLLGFIGDLFNTWFTDPPETIGRMAEEVIRGGKGRVHVGQDGSILVQSCADIVLERVVRVQVPIRLKHEEDPEGVLKSHMNTLDRTFLRQWAWKPNNEHHRVFQLREYVRYLNQYQTLARLHQLEQASGKDWKIPSEAETPAPSIGADEKDRIEANAGNTYWKDCFATVRIYRDGSILSMDAYGNATCMGPYGIEHSSTRHFRVFAAGDIVLKAGGSFFASARRHVEIIASRGTFVTKARTGWRALCERGTLWLKSDYDPDNAYTPTEEGDPEAEVFAEQGIRVQTTKSETGWFSQKRMRVAVTGEEEDLEFDSPNKIKVQSKENLELQVGGSLKTRIMGLTHWFTKGFILSALEGFKMPNICQITNLVTKFNRVELQSLNAHGTIAAEEMGPRLKPGSTQLRRHSNHIKIFEPQAPLDLSLDEETPPGIPEKMDPIISKPAWPLLKPSEYTWDNPGVAPEKATFNFEPPAQQYLRLDGEELGWSSSYSDWEQMSDQVLEGEDTKEDRPWPGKGYKWHRHEPSPSFPSLQVPTSKPAAEHNAESESALTPILSAFKYLKK